MSRIMSEGSGRGRSTGVPPPKTESAIAARQNFYCELCNKGYSRMNEYEAHENSYDHQHKKRFQEMKAMQKDAGAAQRQRERERKESGFVSIKIEGEPKRGAFKKGGFRSAFGAEKKEGEGGFKKIVKEMLEVKEEEKGGVTESESESEDEEWEKYDAAQPTGP